MKKQIITILIAALAFGAGTLVEWPVARAQTDISDPQAIMVSNTIVRPLSEKLRGLYYEMLSVKNQYGGQINTLFPLNGGTILDGREAEGVSTLVSNDAREILLFANTFITAYEAETVAAMTKPCVRPLEVQ